MPVMDGPTAAKALRDLGFNIPIIGVTGNVLPDDIEYFIGMGANIVVGKPVDASHISSEIQRLGAASASKLGQSWRVFESK